MAYPEKLLFPQKRDVPLPSARMDGINWGMKIRPRLLLVF